MHNSNRVYFKSCFNPIKSVHVNAAIVFSVLLHVCWHAGLQPVVLLLKGLQNIMLRFYNKTKTLQLSGETKNEDC